VLRTKVGEFGVTEGEFVCMFLHIITGIFGQQIWHIKVIDVIPFAPAQIASIQVNTIVPIFFAGLLTLISLYSFISTTMKSKDKLGGML